MLLYGTCDLQQLLSRPEIAARNAAYLQEAAAIYYQSSQVSAGLFSLCVLQGEQKQRQYCCLMHPLRKHPAAPSLPSFNTAGECATVSSIPADVWIGSQDATTCVVAMLACPSSRIVWVAHLDSAHLGDRDISGIEHALEQMDQPKLYLVGGYCDAAGQGLSECAWVVVGVGFYGGDVCPSKLSFWLTHAGDTAGHRDHHVAAITRPKIQCVLYLVNLHIQSSSHLQQLHTVAVCTRQ
jgi:hypothetical protein